MVKKEASAALKKLLNDQINKGLVEGDMFFAKPLVDRLILALAWPPPAQTVLPI